MEVTITDVVTHNGNLAEIKFTVKGNTIPNIVFESQKLEKLIKGSLDSLIGLNNEDIWLVTFPQNNGMVTTIQVSLEKNIHPKDIYSKIKDILFSRYDISKPAILNLIKLGGIYD